MKWSIFSLIFITHCVNAQFPNFLKAFYGGGSSSTTKKPPILRRNFKAENALLDDPFNVPPVPNNGIISNGPVPTPGPGTFNNIPLSNGQLQNNYVVSPNNNLNSGPSLVNNNGGGGIVNAPNSFSSSPSVSYFFPVFLYVFATSSVFAAKVVPTIKYKFDTKWTCWNVQNTLLSALSRY